MALFKILQWIIKVDNHQQQMTLRMFQFTIHLFAFLIISILSYHKRAKNEARLPSQLKANDNTKVEGVE